MKTRLLLALLLIVGCATFPQGEPRGEAEYFINSDNWGTVRVTFLCGGTVVKWVRGIEIGRPVEGTVRYANCGQRQVMISITGSNSVLYIDNLDTWVEGTRLDLNIANNLKFSTYLITRAL